MSNTLETLQRMSESPHDYDIGYWWNAVDNAIEEIERLHQSAETKEALLQEKRTEIERLRAECLRLSHAEAEAMSVVLSQEGQIERLRELLREGAEYPGSTQWLWRVREALGE